ncbi:MAG: ATP-binding cassette domain-containing protein, partial [Actinomycetia bacterium]|nr:ATP-binding cassette domain-containing protein [Actinomycetes bacterium]
MIRARGLHLTYPEMPHPALAGLDLDLDEGEVLGVVGAMGAGKTSLCLALAGLAARTSGGESGGELEVAGVDPRVAPVRDLGRRVGLVFEDYAAQLTQITVLSEVMAPMLNRGTPVEQSHDRALELLADLGLAHLDPAVKRTWELSGGQQQRVAIAAALAGEPQVLMLDNVTGMLDPAGKEDVRRLTATLSTRMTLVIVEEDFDLLVGIADRLLVLRAGAQVAHGPATALLRDVDMLTGAMVEPPTVVQVARAADLRTDPLTVEELARGSRVIGGTNPPTPEYVPAEPRDRGGPWAVEVRDVDYRYADGTAAVQGVSLRVAPGEVHAVVGGNGAGKSTLLHLLCGLRRPASGTVVVGDHDTRDHTPAELAHVVGTALQNPDEQITERTVRGEIAYALRLRRFRRVGWLRRQLVRTEEEIADAVERARRVVGLPETLMDADPTHLSRGHRKLVAIAGALALQPA